MIMGGRRVIMGWEWMRMGDIVGNNVEVLLVMTGGNGVIMG